MNNPLSAAVEQIKHEITMEQVLYHYGYDPNRAGFICCPFHGEDTASFKAYDKSFYCFGCHESGDVIKFVQKYLGTDFVNAVKEICRSFGIPLATTLHEQQELRRRAREAERQRLEQKRKQDLLTAKYDAALDLYILCDRIIRECAPTDENDICEAYVMAVKLVDEARDRLNDFDIREVK